MAHGSWLSAFEPGERGCERRSLSDRALDHEAAPMSPDDTFGDVQAEAGSPFVCVLQRLIGIENPFEMFGRNPAAGVFDGDVHLAVRRPCLQRDRTAGV